MINFHETDGQLKFAQSVFPSVVLNEADFDSVEATNIWVKENIEGFEAELNNSGALLFRGFPINSAETFDAFSAAFGYPNFTYKESLSNAVRINFTERVFTANEAPKDVEIYLHHEMAQTPISPDKLFFFCNSAADQGGATPICRSDQLFKALESELPELAKNFESKGLRYTTYMPSKDNAQSGQGRSWLSTLSVDSKDQAEKRLAELGYDWEWLSTGDLKAITPVLPAVLDLDGKKYFITNWWPLIWGGRAFEIIPLLLCHLVMVQRFPSKVWSALQSYLKNLLLTYSGKTVMSFYSTIKLPCMAAARILVRASVKCWWP